jgi:hypothetical protein
MKEIAVSDEQYEYIEGVADALRAKRVGRYGHVRPRDAIQYLIDTHAPVGETPEGAETTDGTGGDPSPEGNGERPDESEANDEEICGAIKSDGDPCQRAADACPYHDEDAGSENAEGTTAGSEEASDDDDRLSAMMNLLETHAEKWGETPSENGRYEVELPDGDLEVVQTKDDVRAALFKNY